jgi:glyoxylate reductase
LKSKVYVSRLLPKPAMDRIHSFCDAEVWEGELPPPRDVLMEKVSEAEGLLCLLTDKVDAEAMNRAPKLTIL